MISWQWQLAVVCQLLLIQPVVAAPKYFLIISDICPWSRNPSTAVHRTASKVCPLSTLIFPVSPRIKSPAFAWTLYIFAWSVFLVSTVTSSIFKSCPGCRSMYCPGCNSLYCPGFISLYCPGFISLYCPGLTSWYCPGFISWYCPWIWVYEYVELSSSSSSQFCSYY